MPTPEMSQIYSSHCHSSVEPKSCTQVQDTSMQTPLPQKAVTKPCKVPKPPKSKPRKAKLAKPAGAVHHKNTIKKYLTKVPLNLSTTTTRFDTTLQHHKPDTHAFTAHSHSLPHTTTSEISETNLLFVVKSQQDQMQATKSTNDTEEFDGVSSISHCEIIPVQDLQPQKSKLGLDLNVFNKEGARVNYKKNGTKVQLSNYQGTNQTKATEEGRKTEIDIAKK